MGIDIAGTATGGALGFITGGPGGAALGGASGIVITKGLKEFVNRVLSTREQTRVSATAAFAIETIKSRLDYGGKLREDGFFEEKQGGKSDADEILK